MEVLTALGFGAWGWWWLSGNQAIWDLGTSRRGHTGPSTHMHPCVLGQLLIRFWA